MHLAIVWLLRPFVKATAHLVAIYRVERELAKQRYRPLPVPPVTFV